MNRAFKGVWIPASIWLNDDLTIHEKLLLVEIDSLDNDFHCVASNAHFAEFLKLSKQRCSDLINSLKKKGFVSVEIKKEGKQIVGRVITVDQNKFNGTATPVCTENEQKTEQNSTENEQQQEPDSTENEQKIEPVDNSPPYTENLYTPTENLYTPTGSLYSSNTFSNTSNNTKAQQAGLVRFAHPREAISGLAKIYICEGDQLRFIKVFTRAGTNEVLYETLADALARLSAKHSEQPLRAKIAIPYCRVALSDIVDENVQE